MSVPSNAERVQNAEPMPPWPQFCCPNHLIQLVAHSGRLNCQQGEQFEIRRGIPRFVPQNSYADGFGAQWKKYRLTQLDSYSGIPITEMRLRNCLGEDLWGQLAGKQVLECGCGAGRFTEHLLEKGAFVTSIDLSDAVEVNKENFPGTQTHRVAQADILRLPFQPSKFDVVLCIGVIQHTRNSEQTIRALAAQVKVGGYLIIDHYTYTLAEFTKAAALIRPIIKRFSPEVGIRSSEQLVKLFLPLHRRARKVRWMQMLLSRISPVVCYYHTFPQLNEELQTEWALLDTHDYLTCWYRHYRKNTEIATFLGSIGLEVVSCKYGGNGVEARARRTADSLPPAATAA